ncbi:MAG: NTP transferase domain-containing protein [Spirochaetaceae bacterium]|jgi:spore coat polysaccharide biosynthesis protein SpsF|nr:NTP transferase domain-containing protein [Spirochaetaceae bacterium]
MIAIILQARLDSSRLPGKALLPLEGKPLLLRVMEALQYVSVPLRILACPKDAVDSFKPLAESACFEIFAGSKEDVLGRFCSAIRHFALSGSRIIRATGDNPFVFCDAAEAICREAEDVNAAYAGYAGLPYGAGVEAVSADALLRAEKEAVSPYHREHVCPYLYENGAVFPLHRPLAPLKWQSPSARLTVDTAADYERAKLLYAELSHGVQAEIFAAKKERPDERFCGERIIEAYRRLFPDDAA